MHLSLDRSASLLALRKQLHQLRLLESSVLQLEDHVVDLTNIRDRLRKQKESLAKQLSSNEHSLESTLLGLGEQSNGLQCERQSLLGEISNISAANEAFRKKIAQTGPEIQASFEQLSLLSMQNQDVKERTASLLLSIEQLRASKEQLDGQIAVVSRVRAEWLVLAQQLEASARQSEENMAQLMEAERQALNDQKALIQQSNLRRSQYSRAQKELQAIQVQLDARQGEQSAVGKHYETRLAEADKVRSELQGLLQREKELEWQLGQLRGVIEQWECETERRYAEQEKMREEQGRRAAGLREQEEKLRVAQSLLAEMGQLAERAQCSMSQ